MLLFSNLLQILSLVCLKNFDDVLVYMPFGVIFQYHFCVTFIKGIPEIIETMGIIKSTLLTALPCIKFYWQFIYAVIEYLKD